jgi:transposase
MKYWVLATQYVCGVDLHWDNMYICLVDALGRKLVHRKLRNNADTFRKVVSRYAHSLTVAVESTGTWYWLCDVCAEMGVTFALGHAQYMKWIHGAKAKNDRIDSEKIARITIGGNLPMAYAHPKELRATRDLLRRRSRMVSMRSGMMSHIKTLNAQANMPSLGNATKSRDKRAAIASLFDDPDMAMSAEVDAVTAEFYDSVIIQIERHVERRTKEHHPKELALLMTIPGVGRILALTILLEIHDIGRFPSRQSFASYARLITAAHMSNGKKAGSAGHKIGNPYLKWAFGEIAMRAPRWSVGINGLLQKLQRKRGVGSGLSILSHKFGRAVYFMLSRGTVFDEEKFLHG